MFTYSWAEKDCSVVGVASSEEAQSGPVCVGGGDYPLTATLVLVPVAKKGGLVRQGLAKKEGLMGTV